MLAIRVLASVLVLVTTAILPARAANKDTAALGKLTLELNNMRATKNACRVSFLIRNGFDATITQSAIELVLFGQNKRVLRIVVVKPGQLPPSKSRVKQFDLKGIDCKQVSRVLLNDVRACDGAGLDPAKCLAAAKPSSLLTIPFDF